MITNIINAGMQEDLPEYLKRRVRPTNILALLLLFSVAIPFIIISLIHAPPLAIVPGIGAITCIFTIVANKYGGIKYSRIFLAAMPVALGAVYNAFLSDANQEPIGSVFLIELAFSMVIFVVFDLREKQFMFPILIYAAILIITFPITKHWVNYDVDTTFIRFGLLSNVTVILGVITAFGCVYGLASLNLMAENQSEELINNMNEKNKKLLDSEDQLKENLRLLEQSQEEEKKRNWATEGLGRVSEILRGSRNDEHTFDKLISEIVKYTKSNQGALYVLEEEGDEKALNRVSSYAFGRKKFLEQKFKPGEGLLGQAYLEKEYVYMVDIPQDYIKITSGLGDSNPNALLIIPLIVNEKVEGMMEIASFNPFAEYEINFMLKLGENIASFIQSDRINVRTQKLLEESMQTSEELRAQEEEMRQNQEELEATQEEMRRQQAELVKVKENLEEEMKIKTQELTAQFTQAQQQLLEEQKENARYLAILKENKLI